MGYRHCNPQGDGQYKASLIPVDVENEDMRLIVCVPYGQRRNSPKQNDRSSKRGEIHGDLVGRIALLLLRPSVTLRLPW